MRCVKVLGYQAESWVITGKLGPLSLHFQALIILPAHLYSLSSPSSGMLFPHLQYLFSRVHPAHSSFPSRWLKCYLPLCLHSALHFIWHTPHGILCFHVAFSYRLGFEEGRPKLRVTIQKINPETIIVKNRMKKKEQGQLGRLFSIYILI